MAENGVQDSAGKTLIDQGKVKKMECGKTEARVGCIFWHIIPTFSNAFQFPSLLDTVQPDALFPEAFRSCPCPHLCHIRFIDRCAGSCGELGLEHEVCLALIDPELLAH